MNLIIALLILFFAILIVASQVRTTPIPMPFREGMTDTDASGNSNTDATNTEYQTYAPNDALILAKQNAGNIEYLKGRVANLDSSSSKVAQYIFDISNNLTTLNDQVNTIVEQQAQYAQSVVSEPAPAMDLSMPSDTSNGTTESSSSNNTSP